MIGLVFLLLLSTPTIWFSLDHERYVSDGVISGIGTLFSLDHKIYASDHDSDSNSDSDSFASENKPEVDSKWKQELKRLERGSRGGGRSPVYSKSVLGAVPQWAMVPKLLACHLLVYMTKLTFLCVCVCVFFLMGTSEIDVKTSKLIIISSTALKKAAIRCD